MSIEALSWGFKQNIRVPGAKLVLLALCDFADESWSCFPGQETLAIKTSQGERTVRRHLEWLEKEGYVISRARFANGRRTSNRYTIHTPRPSTPPPPPRAEPSEPEPDPETDTGADAPPSPEGDPAPQTPSDDTAPDTSEKGTKQAAETTAGQSGHRPDHAEQPANLAGEPSENHQRNNPLPPADSSAADEADASADATEPADVPDAGLDSECSAHPSAPAANCRGCGTNLRSLRAAEAERARREKEDRARNRDRQWFDEQNKRRALAERQRAQGELDGPRRAAREGLRRTPVDTPPQ